MRKSCWQAAIEVFKETGSDAIMTGDSFLIHQIAIKMGWKGEDWKITRRVIQALRLTPGPLESKLTASQDEIGRDCFVRVFRLKKEGAK